MTQYSGYTGKILFVDLTAGEVSTLDTFDYAPEFIGGRGIGAKLHWDFVGPDVEGTDPENLLTFMTSPTTGTPCPGGQKTCVSGVAPHMYPKNSYMKSVFGGMWGPELKYAGWDGVAVIGASETPVYILIQDDSVEIRDATDLWGLDTQALQQRLEQRFSEKYRVACIGPAGENLVSDAVVLSDDSNCAGKGGFGAVMGSKKLKAIVVRGTGSVTMDDPQRLLDLAYETQRQTTRKEYEDEPSHAYRGSLFGPLSTEGNDLWKEGQEGTKVRTGYAGCMMCPIACGMSVKFKDGELDGTGHIMCVECNTEPEEATYNNENYGRVTWARLKQQDKLGYSEWAMHLDIWPLFTYGLLTPEDMDIDAPLGSKEFGQQLLHKICYREGLGDELAKGRAHFLNDFIGTDAAKLMYQMQAVNKGQSRLTYNYGANFYGPIGWLGSCVERGRNNDLTWAFANVITDPRIVVQGSAEYEELQETIAEMLWGDRQAAIDSNNRVFGDYTALQARTAHDYKLWVDSVGSCANFQSWVNMYSEDHTGNWDLKQELFTAVTGYDIPDNDAWYEMCDRVWMLERAIIARQGQTREDDDMFDCIFEDDSYKQLGLTREVLAKGIDDYYDLRGIDKETGLPKRSTLENLGLADVADRLEGEYGIALPA
jgi:aldehyde:ferredoxin oxidoreductase